MIVKTIFVSLAMMASILTNYAEADCGPPALGYSCGRPCTTLAEAIENVRACEKELEAYVGTKCAFEITETYYYDTQYSISYVGEVRYRHSYDTWYQKCFPAGAYNYRNNPFAKECQNTPEICGDGIDNDCDGEKDNGCNACDNNPKCGKPLVCPPPAASVGSSSDADGSADSAGIEGT